MISAAATGFILILALDTLAVRLHLITGGLISSGLMLALPLAMAVGGIIGWRRGERRSLTVAEIEDASERVEGHKGGYGKNPQAQDDLD
jgi:hypothetical protein